jgi:hypothetical protein
VGIRAVGVFIASGVLVWGAAGPCLAEPLPGRFEVSVGGHYLLHHTERCTTDLDSDEKQCGEDWPFAGFDLSGHAQLGPWFALGARFSGSGYIDRETSNVSQPFSLDRNLWLWSAALEARVDPPIWGRALWVGAELGAVVAVASTKFTTTKLLPSDRSVVGVLAGLAVGWDFWLEAPLLLGFEARLQAMTLEALKDAPSPPRRFNVEFFPYISVGVHVGYRW